jgi:uncharacterized protein YdeI (YjbR/CyaY-like superfamily)
MNADPRVDAYIASAPAFAQPILTYLREVIHTACPDAVETVKWSTPFFDYHGPMCALAAFKAHCAFRFWKGDLVLPPGASQAGGTGQFDHITSVKDLPSKKMLVALVKQAAALNEAGVAAGWMEKRKTAIAARKAAPLAVPDDLAAALAKNRKARALFEAFSPSHQREYITWITEAKRDETRQRRLATTIEQLAEGKSRNWKYENR